MWRNQICAHGVRVPRKSVGDVRSELTKIQCGYSRQNAEILFGERGRCESVADLLVNVQRTSWGFSK
jgi:hypothetical protein